MRKLLAVLALSLCMVAQALAITVVHITHLATFGNATSQAMTLSTTPTVGNYIVLCEGFRSAQNGFAVTAVTDNQSPANTYNGVTSVFGNAGQAAGAIHIAKVNTASGSFVITVATGSQTPNYDLWALEVSGISGATDQANIARYTSTVNSFSITNAGANVYANDLVVSCFAGGTYSSGSSMGMSDPPSSGYTTAGVSLGTDNYGGGADAGYKIISSIETDAASWTITTASDGIAMIASFPSSSGGGACTHTGYTQAGTIAVPTANSTVVYRQDGTEAQVNCTGNPYWQPQSGTFGAN
jgi:hypothetical protein